MNDNNDVVGWAVAKLISVWVAVGITSWTQAASFVAFVYTCILIGEWVWHKARHKKKKPPELPPTSEY